MIDPDARKRSLLVKLRKRAKLSQQDLADRLGIRQKTISDWENGKSSPEMPLSTYQRLWQVLGCSVDELIQAFEQEEAFQSLHKGDSEDAQ